LCEEACVREVAEGKPVEIGRLQRFATDNIMSKNIHPFDRKASSGKTIAVIGAGPAGLACAHKLATFGHDVIIYEAREKGGGLNEFGIAAYKSNDDFAQKELEWLLSIGGIKIEYGKKIGSKINLDQLQLDYDAIFIGMGLSGVNSLRCIGEELENVDDAVNFISELRQADSLLNVKVGRDVVVIGGGMTAVDAAVQSKLLGSQNVSLVYRRGKEDMSASIYEQDLATSKGVRIIYNATPLEVVKNNSTLDVKFGYTETIDNKLKQTGETFNLAANQVLKAIGQNLSEEINSLKISNGKIYVDQNGQTNISNIWAGGDCVTTGDDLTVTAVAQGRDAAIDINSQLMKQIKKEGQ
jgi:glutamate synthase (NADPH/NADH) small chain